MGKEIKIPAGCKALCTTLAAASKSRKLTFAQIVDSYECIEDGGCYYINMAFIDSVSYYDGVVYDEEVAASSLYGKSRSIAVDGASITNYKKDLLRFEHVCNRIDSLSILSPFTSISSENLALSGLILANGLRQLEFVDSTFFGVVGKYNLPPIPTRGTIILPGYYNLSWYTIIDDGTNLTVYKIRMAINVTYDKMGATSGMANVTVMTLEEPIISFNSADYGLSLNGEVYEKREKPELSRDEDEAR